jgi:ribosomal protein L4
MNAGERRLGLASALSLKAQDNKIRVLDSLDPKTSTMVKVIESLIAEGSVLFVTTSAERTKNKGIQNIAHTHTDVVTHLSPAEILKYDFCVFTKNALETLSTHFSS